MPPRSSSAKSKKKEGCPFCEEGVVEAKFAYCQPCDVSLRYCAQCETVVVREAVVCPKCGGELQWRQAGHQER